MRNINNLANFQDLISLMRYGLTQPNCSSKPILNLKTIADTLNISTYYVKKALKLRI